MLSIENTIARLQKGEMKAETLVRDCFLKIGDGSGQGHITFTTVFKDEATNQAIEYDKLRAAGKATPSYAGVPISVKDLFDTKGYPTTAGSKLLKNADAAKNDATIIKRLKAAGFIILGKTNMTEFAFSGLGLNPHYGTPLNPYERKTGRIPGGSSSGAAISVTDGFVAAGIGTDTGGSCRIPAALCGIVGFKPSQNQIPRDGTYPLSESLDSIGPLAPTVKSCAILDAIMAGKKPRPFDEVSLQGLNFAIITSPTLDGLDDHVARTFDGVKSRLTELGIKITEIKLSELHEIPHLNKHGGIAAAEAYMWHRDQLETSFDQYDPRVATRIMKWVGQKERDYQNLLEARRAVIEAVNIKTAGYDAMICPTVPSIAPTISSLQDDDEYLKQNMLMLRNPSIFNFLDRCSISIPCHTKGTAPVGLMISGQNGDDRKILSIAAALEFKLR
jgi:aspartyl-tRNA(Asn)/glutamyl-tRNA(Gln) amidotransferase subunit A